MTVSVAGMKRVNNIKATKVSVCIVGDVPDCIDITGDFNDFIATKSNNDDIYKKMVDFDMSSDVPFLSLTFSVQFANESYTDFKCASFFGGGLKILGREVGGCTHSVSMSNFFFNIRNNTELKVEIP